MIDLDEKDSHGCYGEVGGVSGYATSNLFFATLKSFQFGIEFTSRPLKRFLRNS